jgi:hypothetical protein
MVFTKVEKIAQSRIYEVAEIISELKDPLDIVPPSTTSPECHSASDTPLLPVSQDEEVINGHAAEDCEAQGKE